MCGMDEPRGPGFICGLMLAIYGNPFRIKLFYFTITLRHRTPRGPQDPNCRSGNTASAIIFWVELPFDGSFLGRTAVGTLTERLMTHSKGLHHPPTARQLRLASPGREPTNVLPSRSSQSTLSAGSRW